MFIGLRNKMKKLKAGDKVAAYGHEAHGEFIAVGNRGTIIGEHDYILSSNIEEFVDVRFGEATGFNSVCTFHVKQLRKLKSPRWFWLVEFNDGSLNAFKSKDEAYNLKKSLSKSIKNIVKVKEFPELPSSRPPALPISGKGQK